MVETRNDVIIIGGGLGGLTAAIQLKQRMPSLDIMVLERRSFPFPDAAHKVGESTVELAAHYFSKVLGLEDHLRGEQLRKLGIRLFFSSDRNDRIEDRVEMGSDHHLSVPTYQIDRGRFENHLEERARTLGVTVVSEARVLNVEVSRSDAPHIVRFSRDGDERVGVCRWLIDASGRAAVIKRSEGLKQASEHDSNAVWFRIQGHLNVDEWCAKPEWRAGHDGVYSRWYSTNHLTGRGYWVWIIPLVSGFTSVGVVTDPKIHPFSEFRSYEDTIDWLRRHEPQCARMLEPFSGAVADFRAIKHYAHKCARVLSPHRWAITGDAGVFIDPLYSPGSDFIAIQNTFVTDVIARDVGGERFVGRCEVYNDVYLQITEGFLKSYYNQYGVFGNPRIMPFKVLWDYAVYWGFLAFISMQERLCDLDALTEIKDAVDRVYSQNEAMQALFVSCEETDREPVAAGMIDIRRISFLMRFNKGLLARHTDESFRRALRSNLESISLIYEGFRRCLLEHRGHWSTPAEFEALCNRCVPARDGEAIAA